MMTWIDRTKPTAAKSLSGRKAQRHGQMFENLFRSNLFRARMAFDRMPDGCRVVGKGRMIRVRTPYDWIVTHEGRSAFLDTKSFDSDRLMPSNIEAHQLKALTAQANAGALAGYVIWFRPSDVVAFASATDLSRIVINGKGVHASELKALGTSRAFDPRLIFESDNRTP